MEFNTSYSAPRGNYFSDPNGYLGEFHNGPAQSSQGPPIEGQITIAEMGASVPEGRNLGGSFIQTAQNWIRQGVGKLELSTNMGGGPEAVGAEAYGQDARQALREIARANQVEIISIHTPTNIGNMSGYNPQERGFNDEHRKIELEEVKKAIEFAADTGGGAVVIHTGEYQRDMSDQKWAKDKDGNYMFLNYDEEPGRNTLYMVDDRTGKVMTEVRKSMVVREPKFQTRFDPVQNRDRFIDKDGNFLDDADSEALFNRVPIWNPDNTRFETDRLTWKHFEERAKTWNKFYRKDNGRDWTPEEMYMRSQMENRALSARGSSLFHGQHYEQLTKQHEALKKALDFYKQIEGKMPVDEQWRLLEKDNVFGGRLTSKFIPDENKLPSKMLQEQLDDTERNMKYIHEASASADAQADDTFETLKHIVPVSEYAEKNTAKSYAEAGIFAMEQSHNNKHVKRDIFIAPENIFPEMGYGSHPEELRELVKTGRQKMVEFLTSPMIEDPHRREDPNNPGHVMRVANPNFRRNMTKSQAEKEAEQHIKATLDTQHLGMWWKHFQAKPGEDYDERKKRFDKWYMEEIGKLEKDNIIGHIHVVDAIGGGHQHLPLGQGNLPVKQALEYLKKKGYKGTMISEAWGENALYGQGRQMTETWKALGMPINTIYGGAAPMGPSWGDIHNSYMGRVHSPYFIFGSYSPSNDWQLWSQTPME